MKKTKIKVDKTNKEVKYTSTLKILGKVYESNGNSIDEIISNYKIQNPKGLGVLTVSIGDISKYKILQANVITRLFSQSKMMRDIAIKNVANLFTGL